MPPPATPGDGGDFHAAIIGVRGVSRTPVDVLTRDPAVRHLIIY
jgi:hypothetical protein